MCDKMLLFGFSAMEDFKKVLLNLKFHPVVCTCTSHPLQGLDFHPVYRNLICLSLLNGRVYFVFPFFGWSGVVHGHLFAVWVSGMIESGKKYLGLVPPRCDHIAIIDLTG